MTIEQRFKAYVDRLKHDGPPVSPGPACERCETNSHDSWTLIYNNDGTQVYHNAETDEFRTVGDTRKMACQMSVRIAFMESEFARVHRRNAELTASEDTMASKLRCAESQVKMVCSVNEQLRASLDPAICRLQLPDGSVPDNLLDCAVGWKQAYDELASARKCYLQEEDPPADHDMSRFSCVCGKCYEALSNECEQWKRLYEEAMQNH